MKKNKKNDIALHSDEFLHEPFADNDFNKMKGVSRRKFLALVSAGAAVAATSCNNYRDKGEIITYNKKPDGVTYGIADYYASVYRDGSPILIKTREGRPVKIDGNTEHPYSKGKISNYAQASILNLYDPERLKEPLHNSKSIKWNDAESDIIKRLNETVSLGKTIAVVADDFNSPVQNSLLIDFIQKYPVAAIYNCGLFNEIEKKSAWKKCYNNDSFPHIKLDEAKIILSLEYDFLGNEGIVAEQIHAFSKRRNSDELDKFNKLITVESAYSLTGANSDIRFRLNPLDQEEFLCCLLSELSIRHPEGLVFKYDKTLIAFANEKGWDAKDVNELLKEFSSNKGQALVLAGESLNEKCHILVNAINELLEMNGIYESSQSSFPSLVYKSIRDLTNEMKSGKIGAVIHLDVNPVFHYGENLGYTAALKKVPLKIAFTQIQNETSELCEYELACNHDFESWGDFSNRPDIVSLKQPVIDSIWNTRQIESVLLSWINGNYVYNNYHLYLKKYWQDNVFPVSSSALEFEEFWFASLETGFALMNKTDNGLNLVFNNNSLQGIVPKTNTGKYTLILKPNYSIGDGRYANNGWLQELPHPVSKVVWDNYAAVSAKTAEELGIDYKDFKSSIIEISAHGKKISIPAMVQPGMADGVISVELGYGRESGGTVAKGVGVNAAKFINFYSDTSRFVSSNVTVKKTDEIYKLYASQEFHSLDDKFVKDFHRLRAIIIDNTIKGYKENPEFVDKAKLMETKEVDERNLNKYHEYNDVKWAMAIDLNKCVGCSQCVTSCNVENNVPVVGKEQCGKGREMHWIRIDRYYSGTSENPITSIQPMMCQHCDNAPCENVCPVVATTHSPDGLNQMTYNRCVGTRYCANNCPYKVRRFNFLNFRDSFADGWQAKDSLALLNNPEVTVRSRGVMEKCTFCVQRISEARQEAVKDGKKFDGKKVKTACQEACPADAILFGNLNDPDSAIAKAIKSNLNYKVLEVLNVRPNVNYSAKLRNKNSEDKL